MHPSTILVLAVVAVVAACGKGVDAPTGAMGPAPAVPAASSPGAAADTPHPSEPTGAGAAHTPSTPAAGPGAGEGAPAGTDPAGASRKP